MIAVVLGASAFLVLTADINPFDEQSCVPWLWVAVSQALVAGGNGGGCGNFECIAGQEGKY